jgi:hypothetical protein
VIKYRFAPTKIKAVEERMLTVGGKKDNNGDAVLFMESAGWYLTIDNVSIFMGQIKPAFKAGDTVIMTIEEVVEEQSDAKRSH